MKKIIFTILAGMLLFSLAACSGAGAGATSSATTAESASADGTSNGTTIGTPVPGGTPGAGFDSSTMTVDTKLAAGIFLLEDTEQAITPEQAAELLPLWKAVKSLSADDATTADEIQALYDQIEETITPEQLAAIEAMDLSGETMTNLMTKLGIDNAANFGNRANAENMTEDEIATRVAQMQAQNPGMTMPEGGQAGAGGGFGGAGFVPPTGSGDSTPSPDMLTRRSMGMNSMFLDPLIELLTERAAS